MQTALEKEREEQYNYIYIYYNSLLNLHNARVEMNELRNDAKAAKILPPIVDKVRNEKESLEKKIEVLNKLILAHQQIEQVYFYLFMIYITIESR